MTDRHEGASQPMERWVAVFGLGGTIASAAVARGGAIPSRDIGRLLEEQNCIPLGLEVRGKQLRQVASSELTINDILTLADEIAEALDAGAAGVVVAQGTDTIEETAFGLDLLLDGRKAPVAVTGAMRHPDVPGSDAGANLAGALDVAASSAAIGQGVLVVMNDEIHSARFVRKEHTSSPSAFHSSPVGPVGWIVERRVHLPLGVRGPFPGFRLRPETPIPRVALVSIGLGDDGGLLDAVDTSGYTGCVVEVMGGGHVPASLAPKIGALAARLPVVMTSRTGGGSMLERTYAFPGSERDLRERGVISSGYLPSSKARLLLALLLAAGTELSGIADAFQLYGHQDLPNHYEE